MSDLYGIDFSENNGLRTLGEGGRVFTPFYNKLAPFSYGYSTQWDFRQTISLLDSNEGHVIYKFPYILAYENGCLSRNGRYKLPGQPELHHLMIYHTEDFHDQQKLYLFSEYEGDLKDLDTYGLKIDDASGVCKYHSGLKTLKVLGHVTKKRPTPQWYFGNRHVGKKYAFIQIGSDMTVEKNSWQGSAYTEIHSSQIMQVGNGVEIHNRVLCQLIDQGLAGDRTGGDANSDILWIIIDVTDL